MDVDEYIAQIPESRRVRFLEIVQLIESLYPHAKRSMQYKMPTYQSANGWVAIANQKNYISLYTCGLKHIEAFKQKHPNIKTGKGCLNFRDRDEVPFADLPAVITSAMESGHK